MSRALMLESRRYSAVIVSHGALAGLPSERVSQWCAVTGDQILAGKTREMWSVRSVCHRTRSNYYSLSAASLDEVVTSTGFVQGLYVVAPPPEWLGAGPHLLIAAPYVRLLHRAMLDFEKEIGPPRPSYLKLMMADAFDKLGDPPAAWARVSRFSVVNRNEPSVDRVSIAGRNPLRATIGREFAEQGVAYDIRVECKASESFRTNVNLDYHGNLWWYHRGDDSFHNVFSLLNLLAEMKLIESTRTLPTSRKGEEDD